MALNFFDTYVMAGMVEEIVPATRFFADRYFPTAAEDIFDADEVLIEYRDGDRKLAPFVVPRAGDMPISRRGFELKQFSPPSIIPSRLMTLDDLRKRGFGEALYAMSTPAMRARTLQMQDLTDLNHRISRREEWMAVQTLLNNGFSGVSYIDDQVSGEPFDLFYYDTSGSNPAKYTISTEWDDDGDFFGDVAAMCDNLSQRGLPAEDLILGTTTWAKVKKLTEVADYLDNRRMDFGELRPTIKYPGVTWCGRLNFDGFELDVWVVREKYVDESGVTQSFFPEKGALVTAPNCGHTMYGRVDFMNSADQFESLAATRVPELIADRDKKIRKLRITSRPITAPKHKAPWIYAADAVT